MPASFLASLRAWIASSTIGQRILLALALGLLLITARVISKSKGTMPPGPRGLPLLGNIFQLPKLPWYRFTEWKEEFGPIFSLNFAGTPVVVLNSHEVVGDLLERKSTIYSDRPRFIMAGEILTGGMLIVFTGYGKVWRKLRRAGQEGLNVRASEKYQPLQESEARLLTTNMLREPAEWDAHLQRAAASSIASAVYAWPPLTKSDDGLVHRIDELMRRLVMAGLPGRYLVEIFPIMKHLPTWMAKWKREGLEWHRRDTEMFEGFYDNVARFMASGKYKPSLTAGLIERQEKNGLSKKEVSWLAGTMIGAGAETTAASLSVFMLAMTLYPDVMRKAQAEIDALVGRERMPTFADRPHLPYVCALVKEVLRWRPVGPVGVPRRTSEDDWYKGYFIPKGTLVIANVWAMNRDPAIYPDYDEFRPDRFLDASGNEIDIAGTHGQGHVTYGFGRRICIGMHVANQALFIDIAALLWAFNIEAPTGPDGNPILPSRTDFVDEGLVFRPAAFRCKVTPRIDDVATMLATLEKNA
uniref:Cytochrome P450 monooxygenase 58 n=1 Tax=Postia placenta (strain ATCC 44394 / Madison 698-R) TaxID=561896 RepID=CY058_POSPM|nr:RecName: Full=Cytochrome P450 monooxygenase 58 [Postia placenta Mad-698-R]BAK09406.1 cytochrome P450 [Postia placenta]